MELAVRLASGQVTMLEVLPGVVGETARVEAQLRRLAPDVLCVDAALDDTLASREGWYASAVRACLSDRGHNEAASPQLAAAAWARAAGVELVPLLGAAEKPGFFARRKAIRAVTGGRIRGDEPRTAAYAARLALAESDPQVKKLLHLGEESMARRLRTVLVDEARTRVVFVVTYPRSERVGGLLVGRPITGEVARVGHD